MCGEIGSELALSHRTSAWGWVAGLGQHRAVPPPDRRILRDALAVAAAVGVFGLSFGVVADQAALTVAEACALSLLVFAGSSQFAAVGVVAAGGAPVAAVASGLLLNARSVAFGLALAPVLGGSVWRRLAFSQLVIDESTAMSVAQGDPARARQAFWLTGLAVFVLWNLATLLGVVAGGAIGEPEALGLDAAFPAAFVALLAPRLQDRQGRVAAAAGAAIALVAVPIAPAGVPILFAAGGVVVALVVRRRGPGSR
jgi:4-azaleucine resistance transporter AzlC